MHTSLSARYKDTKKMLEKEKDVHDHLTSSFEDDELIQRWEKEPTEPVQGPNGEWSSPLMDPELPSGGYHEAIKEERKKESPTARAPGRRLGATRWISDGIELEHSIRNYNDEAKDLRDAPSSHRTDSQNAKRLALCDRIEKFLKQREYYMPDVAELDVDEPRPQKFYREDNKGGGMDLGMPSSYKSETIEAAGLSSMADLEKELRRGMCNESLASVKRLLRVRAKGFKDKHRHIRGRKQTTRAESSFRTQMKDIKKAGWRYSNSYEALKQLGLSESDQRDYQALLEPDFASLKSYYDAYAERKKGEKKPTMSWIWRTRAAPNTEAGDAEDLKTEWFRSRERYKRWEEQLVLTKREMVMTIRSFQRYQELWEWKSQCPDVTNGMRAYACSQSLFYSKLVNQMLTSCHKYLYDDTVELKWCNDWLRKNVLKWLGLDSPPSQWLQSPMSSVNEEYSNTRMDKIHRPSNGIQELAAGLEDELFGPGGYEWVNVVEAEDKPTQVGANSRVTSNKSDRKPEGLSPIASRSSQPSTAANPAPMLSSRNEDGEAEVIDINNDEVVGIDEDDGNRDDGKGDGGDVEDDEIDEIDSSSNKMQPLSPLRPTPSTSRTCNVT